MPRAAREDHLLRALRIALDEVDTLDALLFHEMIERIDRADDFFQVFPALALSLIAFLEVVRIGDGTQRRRLIRPWHEKLQVAAFAVESHMKCFDVRFLAVQAEVPLQVAESRDHWLKRIDRCVFMRLRQAQTHAPDVRADVEDRRTRGDESPHESDLLVLRADEDRFRAADVLRHIEEERDVLRPEHNAVLSDLDALAIGILSDDLLHFQKRHEFLARQLPIETLGRLSFRIQIIELFQFHRIPRFSSAETSASDARAMRHSFNVSLSASTSCV